MWGIQFVYFAQYANIYSMDLWEKMDCNMKQNLLSSSLSLHFSHRGELFNDLWVILFMYHRSSSCPFKGLSRSKARGQKYLDLKSNSNIWMILSTCPTLKNLTFFSYYEDYSKYLMYQAHGRCETNISFLLFYFLFPESSLPISTKPPKQQQQRKKSIYCQIKSSSPTKYSPAFNCSAQSFYQQEKLFVTTPSVAWTVMGIGVFVSLNCRWKEYSVLQFTGQVVTCSRTGKSQSDCTC